MADIELVIKIPEEEYEDIINSEDCGLHRLTRTIAKGVVLPKGHGDLIDRCELLKEPMDTANYPSNYVRIAKAIIEADRG